ncbi:Uncharacterized protein TCM_046143 [Theobroma cacao]|uniref:Uncharacterized protein n=1 Tax=Theobroma cacao TaxID=3641 RepID=S1RWM0_THECC|nr:Uncharacterized protein TCM_046143 [Theobroma cacao]
MFPVGTKWNVTISVTGGERERKEESGRFVHVKRRKRKTTRLLVGWRKKEEKERKKRKENKRKEKKGKENNKENGHGLTSKENWT